MQSNQLDDEPMSEYVVLSDLDRTRDVEGLACTCVYVWVCGTEIVILKGMVRGPLGLDNIVCTDTSHACV